MRQSMPQPAGEASETNEARRQKQIRQNQAAIALLSEWEREDAEEQRETWRILKDALEHETLTFRQGVS